MYLWDYDYAEIMDALIDWVYARSVAVAGQTLNYMGNMGFELLKIDFVQALVSFFSLLGWALFITGLVVAVFEAGMDYACGRACFKDTALNAIKGFLAVSLFTTVPVRLFKLSINLQYLLIGDITNMGQVAWNEILAMQLDPMLNAQTPADMMDVLGYVPETMSMGLFSVVAMIMVAYAYIKVFFVLTGIDAGSYRLQETAAVPGYVLDDRVWDITLEWGKTTTVTFKNVPLEIKVEVEKRGPVEAIAGQQIQYDFRNIANLSSVALDEFYWHDILPTDAVRLVYITTGTWNEDLTYSVVYRTNLKDSWTTLVDGLITSVDHKLECSAQVLGLASNEYVTEFKFLFGTVQPGFREVKQPTVGCRVLADLPDSYQFTNRTDVGGKYGGKWTYDKDFWTTVVYKTPDRGTLPKTGVWV